MRPLASGVIGQGMPRDNALLLSIFPISGRRTGVQVSGTCTHRIPGSPQERARMRKCE